jgi:small subunit ribosomal protein S11
MAKKKDIKKISEGVLHVHTTPNNTMITLTDLQGNKVAGGGTGLLGYKGAKQNTPYAAEMLAKQILKDAEQNGLKEVGIIMRGTGMGRDGVFKAIQDSGNINIMYITEKTGIKFGGTKGIRPKKN